MGFPHKSDLWDDDGKLLSRCKNSCPLYERIMEFAREASSFARLYLSFKENKDGRIHVLVVFEFLAEAVFYRLARRAPYIVGDARQVSYLNRIRVCLWCRNILYGGNLRYWVGEPLRSFLKILC